MSPSIDAVSITPAAKPSTMSLSRLGMFLKNIPPTTPAIVDKPIERITIASIFLGVGGGVLLYFHGDMLWLNYVGIFLIIWANTFDSADGQLARMTKQYSKLGRILDGFSGDLWFVAIYFAICFRINEVDPVFAAQPWLIWVIASFAGLFHAKQASIADYYRQFHLYFLLVIRRRIILFSSHEMYVS